MAETCIVCLGDLRTSILEDPPPESSEDGDTSDDLQIKKSTRLNAKRYHT